MKNVTQFCIAFHMVVIFASCIPDTRWSHIVVGRVFRFQSFFVSPVRDQTKKNIDVVN